MPSGESIKSNHSARKNWHRACSFVRQRVALARRSETFPEAFRSLGDGGKQNLANGSELSVNREKNEEATTKQARGKDQGSDSRRQNVAEGTRQRAAADRGQVTEKNKTNFFRDGGNEDWTQVHGRIRQNWDRFSEEEVSKMNGNWDHLANGLEKTYGFSQDQARDEVGRFRQENLVQSKDQTSDQKEISNSRRSH